MTSRSKAYLPGHDEDCGCYGCEELRLDGRQRKRRPSDGSDMSLDELLATQDKGGVPGDKYRSNHEIGHGLDPAEVLRMDRSHRLSYGPDD